MRQRHYARLALAALAFAGCNAVAPPASPIEPSTSPAQASLQSTPSISPIPTPVTSATAPLPTPSTPTASATQDRITPPPATIDPATATKFKLSQSAVRSVPEGGAGAPLDAFGNRIAVGYSDRVEVVDVGTGTVTKVATIGDGTGFVTTAALTNGDEVVVVWFGPTPGDALPDDFCHPGSSATLHVDVFDIATRQQRTLDSEPYGFDQCTAETQFALDGDVLASAIPDATGAWTIAVTNVTDGSRARTLVAPGPVESLDISGDTLIYSYGRLEQANLVGGGSATRIRSTHLMAFQAGDPQPVELATDAYSVRLDGRRVMWEQGENADVTLDFSHLMTANIDDWSPVDLGVIDYPDFSISDGVVVWRTLDATIGVWSAETGRLLEADPTWLSGMWNMMVSEGWVSWVGFGRPFSPDRLYAIPLSEMSG